MARHTTPSSGLFINVALQEFVFSLDGRLGICFKWLLADCGVCACYTGVDDVGKPAVMETPGDECSNKANVLLTAHALC